MKTTKNILFKLMGKYRLNSVFMANFLKLFGVIFLIVAVFGIYIYRNAVTVMENELLTMNENHVTRMSDLSESMFREIEYIASNVAIDNSVRTYMMSQDQSPEQERIDRVRDKMLSYRSINKYIESIYVYSEISGRICSSEYECDINEFGDTDWLAGYDSYKDGLLEIMARSKKVGYPYVLTFIKPTHSLDVPGAVVLNINLQAYGNVMDSYVEDNMRYFIVDEDGTVIYNKNEELMQTPMEKDEVLTKLMENNKTGVVKFPDESYVFSKKKSYYYGWDYVSFASLDSYSNRLINSKIIWIIILPCILLVGIVIASILALSTLKPFESVMSVFEDGDSIKAVEKMKDNEVKYFAKKIITLIGTNRTLKDELDRKLRLYNDAQLLALQSQINPHFINNTLNIINMSIIEEAGFGCNSSKLLIALSKILKAAFETDKTLITIEEEVHNTEIYADLLKRRYEDLFEVIWDVDENILSKKILKLCLQPLIENAVYHGLSKTGEGGYIKITLKNTGMGVYASVEDNGCGMDEEQLEQTRNYVFKGGVSNSHVGIKNVYMRLKIIFGDEADFGIESVKDEGTKVWFKF